MHGESIVLIGMQYGDEGKGKFVDSIIEEENIHAVARFNGGPNAGHSITKTLTTHQIPSGVRYPGVKLYIGSGCVHNPVKAVKEIEDIERAGFFLRERLYISGNVTLIQPHHILLDKIFGKAIGSTANGIGPAYAGRVMRILKDRIQNLRFDDYLANPDNGMQVILNNLEDTVALFQIPEVRKLYRIEQEVQDANLPSKVEISEIIAEYDRAMGALKDYLCNDSLFFDKLVKEGNNVLFEGAQSAMLDVVSGTVPFVTSSRTTAPSAYSGGDLSFEYHKKTIGVAKAIMSRVGNGPFVSEFGSSRSEEYCMEDNGKKHSRKWEAAHHDINKLLKSEDRLELGIALRMLGGEYGASTGRPRRLGALDLVALKQKCLENSVDELYLTKVDCLADLRNTALPGIPLVVGYKLNGEAIDYVPSNIEEHRQVKPIVKYLPHISENIFDIRSYDNLPHEVKSLLAYLEEKVEVEIGKIGVGPEKEQVIDLRK